MKAVADIGQVRLGSIIIKVPVHPLAIFTLRTELGLWMASRSPILKA